MLKVIVNRCPIQKIEEIKETLDEGFIFLNDNDLYKILNGEEEFENKSYIYERVDRLVDKISEISLQKDILIHTFNPLVLNWFEDDKAKESFFYFSKNKLLKFFDNSTFEKKLEVLGPGEVIVDTDFLSII